MISSDGIHKLLRGSLAAFTIGCLAAVVIFKADVTLEQLAMIASPAITYIGLKWTGRTPE